MKYNGTTVPTTRDNTYNSEEIHRKDDTELFETAFNKDQKTFLTRLTGAINEIRESILGILPSVSSDDNGKVLTVVNGAWDKASGGGSSANPLIVSVEYDAEVGTSHLDHTWQEIYDAFPNVAIYTGLSEDYSLSSVDGLESSDGIYSVFSGDSTYSANQPDSRPELMV